MKLALQGEERVKGHVITASSFFVILANRYKLMKWWAQSFLVGVPKIVCGFRDDDGLVKSLQPFKTATIPHDSQVSSLEFRVIVPVYTVTCTTVHS